MYFNQRLKWRWPIVSILITFFMMITVACTQNTQCDEGQTQNSQGTCVPETVDEQESPLTPKLGVESSEEESFNTRQYDWEPERFSWGQRSLLSKQDDPFMKDGTDFFKQRDFESARKKFLKSAQNSSRAPEAIIYKNNSIARLQKAVPFTIAVPIPIDDNFRNAEEILRGVAQAQEKFNSSPKSDLSRLLEVVIVDDGLLDATPEEKESVVKEVAGQISADKSILGVVGHNSSGSTGAALPQYERANLAVVSPTSTSIYLESDVFFRVAPSDAVAAKKLACYIKKKAGKEVGVVIFFDSGSDYSNSFKEKFTFSFTQGEAGKVSGKDMLTSDFDAFKEVYDSAHKQKDSFALLVPSTKSSPIAIDIARENQALDPSRKLQLVGGDSLYGKQKLDSGAQSLNGLVLPVAWFSDVESSKGFYEEGFQQWGGGTVNWRTAMSHDATAALIKVFSENSTSREDVVNSLKSVKLSSDETSGTELRFNSNRERPLTPVLIRVEANEALASRNEFKYKLIDEEYSGQFCTSN